MKTKKKLSWYYRNRERVLAKQKIWNTAHKEELREYHRVYQRKYSIENREKMIEAARKIRRRNIAQGLRYDGKPRKKKSAESIKAMLKEQGLNIAELKVILS